MCWRESFCGECGVGDVGLNWLSGFHLEFIKETHEKVPRRGRYISGILNTI